jgi:LysR family transcriptional regulator of beta-lactamase
MIEAAAQGLGVALAPPSMFRRHLAQGLLRQPFATAVSTGQYWLTSLKSRMVSAAMVAFRDWIVREAAATAAD